MREAPASACSTLQPPTPANCSSFNRHKMASPDIALRLKFLQESASLLSSQNVATAGHLMALHNRTLHEDSRTIKPRQHKIWCGACGCPRIARHTKVANIKQRTGKGKSRFVPKGAANEVVVYKCLRCSRRTIQNHPRTRALHATPTVTQATSTVNVSTEMSSTPATSTKPSLDNASSKKRAKARKQGGLHALLASKQRSQESKPSGSSLDLFDFLQ